MDMLGCWRVITILFCTLCFFMGSISFARETNHADVLVLLDGTGSVTENGFNMSLEFVKMLVGEFVIGPSDTQFAFVVFTINIVTQFNWNTYTSASELIHAISRTKFPSSSSGNASQAISYARSMFLSTSTGRRTNAAGIILFISDGIIEMQLSIEETSRLKDLCIIIYTVVIGDHQSDDNLKTLASKSSNYFTVDDSDAVQSISESIKSSASSDACAGNKCKHGRCCDLFNSFVCVCEPGYTGTSCEQDVDECQNTLCQNGGTCVDGINSFLCNCSSGYTGIYCDTEINECESSPCENDGTCKDWVNRFYCDCPHGFYGTFCETGICQPYVADIVFVLDSSASQTKEEFEKQLDFVNHFIDNIVIGDKNFNVGVVTYSSKAVIDILLGEFKDSATLKEAVRNIKYRPGPTFTDKGLEKAKEVFNNAPHLRPYHKTAKRFAFVLTDGLSANRVATAKAAASLKSSVNKVLAIGIGKEVSHLELLSIASAENSDTGRKYVYSVQNFNALYTVVQELVALTCEECYWKTSSDVMFLLDISMTVSVSDFQTGINAITYLVHRTTQMENEENTVRTGLVTYGMGIQVQRKIFDSNSKQMFLSSLQKLVPPEGHCPVEQSGCGNTQLNEALRYTSKNMFDQSQNAMTEKRDIVVILSNGKQMLTDETLTELEKLRTSGKYVYVIALGPEADIQTLQSIAGDPALVFSVYDELSQQSIDALTSEFFFSSCNLTNDFLKG